jgi:hypothetical protein
MMMVFATKKNTFWSGKLSAEFEFAPIIINIFVIEVSHQPRKCTHCNLLKAELQQGCAQTEGGNLY